MVTWRKTPTKNLGQLRKSAFHHVKSSLLPPIQLLTNIAERLKLKDNQFQLFQSCTDMQQKEILEQVDSTLTKADTTQQAVKGKNKLQSFLSHCCQVRKYSFCVRKCGDIACKLCKPVCMEKDLFDTSIRHLPDPILNPSDPEHYLPFSEAFGKETSEKDCPSLVNHKKKVP